MLRGLQTIGDMIAFAEDVARFPASLTTRCLAREVDTQRSTVKKKRCY